MFCVLLPSLSISECDLINQVNIEKVLIDMKMPYISDIFLQTFSLTGLPHKSTVY